MIEKPKRPKKLNNQDRKIPINIQELINRYDLENKDIYDYLDSLTGLLSNKFTDVENTIEEKTEKNIITAYSSTEQTVSNDTKINLTDSIRVGDKLTLSNNNIVIGSGVSHVKISGTIFYQDFDKGTGYFFSDIKKNNTQVSRSIMQKGASGSASYQSVWFAEKVIEVAQGDLISMTVGDINGNSCKVRNGSNFTYLTVEVVD